RASASRACCATPPSSTVQARARAWTVLLAAACRRSGKQPFAPLLEALAQQLAGRLPRAAAERAGRGGVAGVPAARAGRAGGGVGAALGATPRAGAAADVRGGGMLSGQRRWAGRHAAGAGRPAVGGARCPRPAGLLGGAGCTGAGWGGEDDRAAARVAAGTGRVSH